MAWTRVLRAPALHTRNRTTLSRRSLSVSSRACSASRPQVSEALDAAAIDELLAKPSWDVRSLLPTETDLANANEVTPAQLHHLLRLSALPQPATADEEQSMLKTLHSQLHFVRQIQTVDTTGVEPLVALRDETRAAQKEQVVDLASMQHALAREEVVGRRTRRFRRRPSDVVSPETREAEDWDPLAQAPKRVGRLFIVDGEEV